MSGNVRDGEDDREGAMREEDGAGRATHMPEHLVSLADSVSKMLLGPDARYCAEFMKQLVNWTGQGNSLDAPQAPQNDQRNTSTGSVQPRSYVTIEERVHQDEYPDIISTIVHGAMKTESCTWELVEESLWDHKLTSHKTYNDWVDLFKAGLPQGKEVSREHKRSISVLHQGSRTMTLYRQYLATNRHDPHKLVDKLEAQQRALQEDDHEEWPQNKLVLIIGQCRNLNGAAESDDGDTRWYVVGWGEVALEESWEGVSNDDVAIKCAASSLWSCC